MSHVSEFTGVIITSIPALQFAIQQFCPGCELVQQSHYRTWKDDHNGQFVGDWKGPAGVDSAQLGDNALYVIRATEKCLRETFKLTTRDGHTSPYEIGVVARGNGEFTLMADFWNQGNGLLKLPGLGIYDYAKNAAFADLFMYYRMAEQRAVAMARGDDIEFEQQADRWVATVHTKQAIGS